MVLFVGIYLFPSSLMIFCISGLSVVTSPLSFLILFYVFRMSLDKGLLLYLIQVPAISFIDFFFHCYLDFISFISTLVFMIFFLWPMLGLIWSFSLGPLGVYLDFFLCIFSVCFFRWTHITKNFLKLLLLHPLHFGLFVFP